MSSPRLTARGQGFLAAGVTLTVLAMLFGLPDLTRVGVLLTALPVLTLLTGWRRAPRLEARRAVAPPLLAPDEPAQVRLTLRSTGRGRTLVQLAQERVDPALGAGPHLLLPRLLPGETHTLSYSVSGRRRGRYELGPLTLRQPDPFGLSSTAAEVPGTEEVVVLPRIEALGPEPPHGRGLGQEGRIARMVAVHGEDDASIRAYRDGDDLRRVHWPTTAHRGELMVRQEDRPARRRAVLLLDGRRSVHRGTGPDSSLEWAVGALASVAVHLAGRGFAVHLAAPGTLRTGAVQLPLSLPEVLRHLALTEASDDGGLDPLLHAAHTVTGTGGLVVAAATDHDHDELERLGSVRTPGTSGLLLLLRTAAFDGPATARPPAAPPAALLGWRTTLVGPDDTVRSRWAELTAGEPVAAR